MLITKDKDVIGILNKKTISLLKIFVPQENCISVNKLNDTSLSLKLPRNDLDNIVLIDSVSFRIDR